MKRLILLLTLFGVLSLACARTAETPASAMTAVPTAEATVTPQPVLPPDEEDPSVTPLRNRIQPSLRDVTYCTMDGMDVKMDVYFPADTSQPVPAVIYIHGGGWTSGDKRAGAGTPEIPVLVKAGFVAFSLNYRLAPEYRFPAMIEDVKCAIRSIRAHADEYHIDPEHIGVWGGSAGGHLVSLLGTSDESAGFDVGQYLEYSSRVQAVVDMFGPSDLLKEFRSQQEQNASHVFFLEQLESASPITYITPDDPPFLILQGDQDEVVPMEQSQILYDRLTATGVPATLVIVHNAGHGFKPTGGAIDPSRGDLSQMILDFFTKNLK